jgi:hypothetical protein
VAVVLSTDGVLANDQCWVTPGGVFACEVSGALPHPGGPGDSTYPPDERPPIRYLIVDTDYTGADCYWWSGVAIPGAIDTWDPGNDPTTIITLLNLSPCATPPPTPGVDAAARAWEVYRSWTLAAPSPALSPPATGITGLPTYVGTTTNGLNHVETLPSGIDLVVSAAVTGITVDWGDGTANVYSPDEAVPYPDGAAFHTYALKTCSNEYRATHPSGHLCHPSLAAYPITVTFTWTAGYSYDAGWVELESVTRATTVPYDVDEIVGVPSR